MTKKELHPAIGSALVELLEWCDGELDSELRIVEVLRPKHRKQQTVIRASLYTSEKRYHNELTVDEYTHELEGESWAKEAIHQFGKVKP